MSNVALFAAGTVVTLLVVASLALLTWGAIMDGRYDEEHGVASVEPKPSPTRPDPALRPVDAA